MKRLMRALRRLVRPAEREAPEVPAACQPKRAEALAVDIAPNDSIIPYLESADGSVDVQKLELDSPAVRALRESGVRLVVPLRSDGELIGFIIPQLNLVLVLPSLHSHHFPSGGQEVRPPAPLTGP